MIPVDEDVAAIAKGLSKAQRELLLVLPGNCVETGEWGSLKVSPTPLGLAVRAHLKATSHD